MTHVRAISTRRSLSHTSVKRTVVIVVAASQACAINIRLNQFHVMFIPEKDYESDAKT